MIIVKTIKEMQHNMKEVKRTGKTIGFVPTMGYLHEGHLSLIERAKQESDFVAVSIFVNPLQFGPNEDFDRYPRNIERDKKLAEEAGADVLFCPDTKEMYPDKPVVTVSVNRRTDALCGKSRIGHFDGVATVLTKLFHIVLPDKAFFGLKDAQQVAVVQGLVDDFNFPIEIVGCETKREADGLAKSSRNVYLTEEERKQAHHLYQSLGKAQGWLSDCDSGETEQKMIKYLEEHTVGTVEYCKVLSYPELLPPEKDDEKLIIALSVRFSKARLIDNVIIDNVLVKQGSGEETCSVH
ncbi:pantoate--beta-alanine ligase [Fictibacillus phosphorivorans]|uniref:pantoate--beta-alanine ligase n=1 Tax=Fictibacillus phosphorivorans TaxID=1221500 RepID=UPI0020403C04|nr:pantoate--beta-alanine ligase [Fictibacillus phosphorivorans]MCM3718904.1 pantoate--beta-alanine ligase [Fictibacillus phosphorivorans]MCM3776526.1 pantoate--beta-alanine ligase [Fictibacillus phosphorivorans]